MDITYLAETCLRLRGREGTVLLSPTEAVMTQDADLALLSEPDGDAPERIRVKKVLAAPGEFEFGGVIASSYGSYAQTPGPKAERNLIWLVELDGVTVCHLGRLGHPLSKDAIDQIGSAHVLLVPVGNQNPLKPDQVNDMISEFDPRFVVPYTYDASDAATIKKAAAKLAAELGAKPDDIKPKLSVNRSAISGGSGVSFVMLEPKK